ncbi:hypothetical protein HMPREF9123_1815 [Neisseria bacilliformis ATCC BAA-1200]|uniref:Uncharacterized protein n=1 Tax=Neisseria bacilliformis ATCC BAA-1200 TaxID=888742 RepID=F2BDK9_9NEIS|nr:hypothetical protein HMPREF9123_1815 [Neisseria bacilliformis ATCC BAA-1200]
MRFIYACFPACPTATLTVYSIRMQANHEKKPPETAAQMTAEKTQNSQKTA